MGARPVILNLTENPETSVAVNWRTDTTVTSGFVEIATATAGPELINSARQVPAQRQFLKVKHGEELGVLFVQQFPA